MAARHSDLELTPDRLRWRLDPAGLPFKTTDELEPLDEIVGQRRGVEAFRFGMGMRGSGYNIFVTGEPGSGRLSTVKRLLAELSASGSAPDDLCYVNNFKRPEQPILLRFAPGEGSQFKKDMQEFLDNVRREATQLFESEEYIARKNAIAEAHEKKVLEFYKEMEEKVKDTGLVVVRIQMGPFTRPDVMPLVDGEPKRMIELEEMVKRGRFPAEEYQRLEQKRAELRGEIDHIVQQVRLLQKEIARKHEEVDRLMFKSLAQEYLRPLYETYAEEKVRSYLDSVIQNMEENLDDIRLLGGQGQAAQGAPFVMTPPPEIILQPYQVNLLVDNSGLSGPPVVIESYPTYHNLFGSIERITDRTGSWRTDFTKIKAGSFIRANGGYLVVNLVDAIMEPGVWQTLKRSLKTAKIEIETYDPFYFFTSAGLKPEPIDMEVKVVVLGDPRLYYLLRRFDEDTAKIFKVRADYETSMDRTDEAVTQMARFVKAEADKARMRPFEAGAVAALVEEAVRMTGRQEKLSTAFPLLADLLAEADHFAQQAGASLVGAAHVAEAVESRIRRANRIEEQIQEMIDRGSLFVDVEGEAVGQVNGLAVYSLGDHAFGKPSRITAVTSMGREGIINIEREAELSGPIHNKGMFILAGCLRSRFAQDRPLSLAASIAFEQSYGGVDGDSASSTELYALLSSLSGKPIRQDIAVTGSVNQKGEVQPIGGVNEKIEGFYLCCKSKGLTGSQGVLIPEPNVKDLMLRQEVVDAVQEGRFHVFAARTVDQGIELLTGVPSGERGADGVYPEGSLYRLVDERLKALAEGLRDFAKDENGVRDKKGSGAKRKDKIPQ